MPDPKVLQQWLSRIQEAANKVNYTGIYVVSTPGQLATARILHFSDGRQQWERIGPWMGQPRVVLRHNERVVTLCCRRHGWPSPNSVPSSAAFLR